MITAHASNIGQELAGLTASEGAVMVAALALGSCLGRFGFGALSDSIGRYKALALSLAANAVVMLFCIHAATTFVTFLVAVAAVGACFGGTMSIVPAIVGDAFGSVNFGQNYSFVYPRIYGRFFCWSHGGGIGLRSGGQLCSSLHYCRCAGISGCCTGGCLLQAAEALA